MKRTSWTFVRSDRDSGFGATSDYRVDVIGSARTAVAACIACVCAIAVVAWLAQDVHRFEQIDANALNWLSSYRYGHPSGRAVLRTIAALGDPLPQLAMLAGACLIGWRRGAPRPLILAALVLVAGADATTQLLKLALGDEGPQKLFLFTSSYQALGTETFPSGHATAMLSMGLAFLLVVPRSWRGRVAAIWAIPIAVVCVVLVTLHRHHPSDVLGGLLVAGAWFFAVEAALHRNGVWSMESAESRVCQAR